MSAAPLRALAWTLLVLMLPSAAHEGPATGFATLEITRNVLRYTLAISPPPASLAATPQATDGAEALASAIATHVRIAADGAPCAAGPARVVPGSGAAVTVTAQVDFVCRTAPVRIALRDDLYDVLGDDVHVLLRIEAAGAVAERIMASEARSFELTLNADVAEAPGYGRYFAFGVEHILIGYDHLLFLLALLLRARTVRAVIVLVTAFTVSHSITLALAALGVVVLSSALVEAAIAASIVLAAATSLRPGADGAARRWPIAFLFGLVHGFGFSSVLGEIGLPAERVVPALLGFNLGVEAGQLLVVALAWPLLAWLARRPWQAQAVQLTAWVIVAVGMALLAMRIPALW